MSTEQALELQGFPTARKDFRVVERDQFHPLKSTTIRVRSFRRAGFQGLRNGGL
jgi:hypothetical protein